jgi:hypothetical protein
MSTQIDTKFAQALGDAIAQGLRQSGYGEALKGATGHPTTNWIHGPGGILGSCALEQQVVSARITPTGLSSVLPLQMTRTTNPEFAFITGMESSGDAEPTTECANCPSGITQSCIQIAQLGRVCRETKELDIDRTIKRINRGEIDYELINDILGLEPRDVYQAVQSMDFNTILNVATAWAMIEVGSMFQQALVPMTFQGNPGNNVGTGYLEFPGLDLLISQNYVDAHTGANCAALDADVKSFDWADVGLVDANGNFRIVTYLSWLEQFVYYNSVRMRLQPATWIFAMRAELWHMLTEIWPIVYQTSRGLTAVPPGTQLVLDATDATRMRDEMRRGMYIDINGRRHGVVIDDGIVEYNEATGQGNLVAGQFASNIYMIPLTVRGNIDATYYEALDFRATAPELAAAPGGLLANRFWTDDGRFLWTIDQANWCYVLLGKIEPRIILRTPMLSGKIEYVAYTPLQHFRDFDEDSDYFVKGGEPSRPAPSFWAPWNLPSTYSRP